MADKIIIKGLEVFSYHGVNQSEKEEGQEFVLDAELSLDLSTPCATDNLWDTVSYAKAIKLCKRLMSDERNNLIERVAQRLADGLLEEYPSVESVKILLKKPNAPIKADFTYVAVEIERHR